jgi:hypothetical protein
MIWIIQTNKGAFESAGKKRVINRMISYYGINDDQDLPQIEAIFSESGKELCKNGIRKIEDYIEEEVKQWRREAKENSEAREESRSELLQRIFLI